MNLHPAIEALVADPRMTVRVPPAHIPLDRIRNAANAAMTVGPAPKMAAVQDLRLGSDGETVPVRVYRPTAALPNQAIVFCHGGGFVWGSLDTHDGLCRRMADRTRSTIVSVDYRLSPDAPFPAAETDVLLAATAVLEGKIAGLDRGCAVSLCGDSAGGYLACDATSRLVSKGLRPHRLVLIYPALDPDCGTDSHERNGAGPVLTSEAMRWFWAAHGIPAGRHFRDLGNLPDFPPAFLLNADRDPLCDEGQMLLTDLKAAGVDAVGTTAVGMVHGFLSLPLPEDVRSRWENEAFDYLA
ncbi:alpha/beta hydrolase [Aquibium carbonis]|nr:alpha/beta hydrolase [Aquibium carbonis]